MNSQLSFFNDLAKDTKSEVVNVASVPQRSPFRYPGGKTWLIPVVRKWLKQSNEPVPFLIEPFAGGGIVSLTAVFEKLASKVLMIELDQEVSAVWQAILNGDNDWLAEKILTFDLTTENVKTSLQSQSEEIRDIAFNTILKNRVFHGGILAKGAGMIKHGEKGKGLNSRWYPKTLHDRIKAIAYVKNKIEFKYGNAFDILEQYKQDSSAYFFIDPPYTIAGKRLYTYSDLDHELLFQTTSSLKGRFMLTYDNTPEIKNLIKKYKLCSIEIPMKTTHHREKSELIISDNFSWW